MSKQSILQTYGLRFPFERSLSLSSFWFCISLDYSILLWQLELTTSTHTLLQLIWRKSFNESQTSTLWFFQTTNKIKDYSVLICKRNRIRKPYDENVKHSNQDNEIQFEFSIECESISIRSYQNVQYVIRRRVLRDRFSPIVSPQQPYTDACHIRH